jgi:hypothetical protein
MISKSFLIQDALVDTFDGTLVARHETGIVAEGRQLKSGSDPIGKLGKLFKSPFEKFTPKAFIRYVMYLPLNFIPVVGTVIFVLIQGRTRGQCMSFARYCRYDGIDWKCSCAYEILSVEEMVRK